MVRLGAAHPGYGFERHMGYSVPEHFAALNRLGPTIHHRRSFAPVAALYGETVVEVAVTEPRCRSIVRVVTFGFSRRVPRRPFSYAGRPISRRSACFSAWLRRDRRAVGALRRNGVHLPVRRTAAHAAAHAVLDDGGAAGRAVDARAGAVLFGAARRAAAGAGDRARIPARHRFRSAAGVLARRDRVSRCRHVRRLSAVADLHRRHLLGGAGARPRHRRRCRTR